MFENGRSGEGRKTQHDKRRGVYHSSVHIVGNSEGGRGNF